MKRKPKSKPQKRRTGKIISSADQFKVVSVFAITMESACTMLRRTRKELEIAKDAGCIAFKRNGNVNCCELLRWLVDNESATAEVVNADADLQISENRIAKGRAERIEFENGVRRKQFVPVDEVRQTFTRCVVGSKAKLLAIPSSLAPRLAIENDPHKIEAAVKSAIIDALTELSKGKWNDVR